jgi:nicotinamidase-related amidase
MQNKTTMALIFAFFLVGCASAPVKQKTWREVPLDKQKSAILAIEFQKTWTQDSFFHWLIEDELESRNVLENAKTLLNLARENNIKVIHAPFILDKNDPATYDKIPFLPKFFGQFTANTWRAEFTDGIFKKGDFVAKGRTAFDATVDSNLLEILKNQNIKTVYIIGFTTDHCVSETMDALIRLGYKAIMVSDGSACSSRSTQQKMENQYHWISTASLLQQIKNH